MTRTLNNWSCKPGSFNAMNTELLFESDNDFGIPCVKKIVELNTSDSIPVNYIKGGHKNKIIHTFVEDYYLERLWKHPLHYLSDIEENVFITPDFSLYTDYPYALQLFNVYRNRYIGRLYQEYNLNVIPSISWANELSFEFCFEGVENKSIVAISSQGVYRSDSVLFFKGLEMLLKKIEPTKLICYGNTYRKEIESMCDVLFLDSFSTQMRKRINGKK